MPRSRSRLRATPLTFDVAALLPSDEALAALEGACPSGARVRPISSRVEVDACVSRGDLQVAVVAELGVASAKRVIAWASQLRRRSIGLPVLLLYRGDRPSPSRRLRETLGAEVLLAEMEGRDLVVHQLQSALARRFEQARSVVKRRMVFARRHGLEGGDLELFVTIAIRGVPRSDLAAYYAELSRKELEERVRRLCRCVGVPNVRALEHQLLGLAKITVADVERVVPVDPDDLFDEAL